MAPPEQSCVDLTIQQDRDHMLVRGEKLAQNLAKTQTRPDFARQRLVMNGQYPPVPGELFKNPLCCLYRTIAQAGRLSKIVDA